MTDIVYDVEGFRAFLPEETLRWIRHRELEREVGVVEKFSDRIGPVPVEIRRRRSQHGEFYHAGKGTTRTQARVSAVMECVERAAAEPREELIERDPEDDKWTPAWYRTEPREWIEGVDLTTHEPIYVPANEVFHPWLGDTLPSHTNGLSAGRLREEAVVQGLLEVVERDSWSIVEYFRIHPPELEVHGELEELRRSLEWEVGRVELRLLPSRVEGVYVVGAITEAERVEEMVMGFGASPDPEMAVLRALLEVAQGLSMARRGIESPVRKGLGEFSDTGKLTPERLKRMNRHWFEPGGTVEIDDLDRVITTGSLEKLTEELVERVAEAGLGRVIEVDLTLDDLNVPVVRMRVTGASEYVIDGARVGKMPKKPPGVPVG
ncbi:YcaO-related McrA-glycine thioamidation protein [Methanopyrus sp.]